MKLNDEIRSAFQALIDDAYRVSTDLGGQVEQVLRNGKARPLSKAEAVELLTKVVTVLRMAAERRGDATTAAALEGEVSAFVDRVVSTRDRMQSMNTGPVRKVVPLIARNGIDPKPVFPRPVFHGMEVAVNGGFLKTSDIDLWHDNKRLDIHLGQFEKKTGRSPEREEVLEIMLSRMDLPGLDRDDQFAIEELARSIAVNGVRKPPIIDVDGTLLDGNRRVAACHYILNHDDFDSEEKRRAEYIFVWQLTEHATDDERGAVVVSLNFEPDHKQDWPEYIKAREVYKEWHAMLAREPRLPNQRAQAAMKRELSKRFALGLETSTVSRYLKMVDWAQEFEDYHINERGKDEFEVKHRANRYFQYFDELAKGQKPGGVAHALTQDDAYRHLVFDLLYDGKFRNWRDIRQLKYIYENEDAREVLQRARRESDPDEAEEHLENAMSIARQRKAEQREVGANSRIDAFVDWLEKVPVRAFRDTIKPDRLRKLLRALLLVEKQAKAVLGDE